MLRITILAMIVGKARCWYSPLDAVLYERTLQAHEWEAGDGSGLRINHSEALNMTIGHFITRLYVDLDSILISSPRLFPRRMSFSDEFRSLYLYASRGAADIIFDSQILNEDEEHVISQGDPLLGELLDSMDEDASISLLGMLTAMTLGARVDRNEVNALIIGSRSSRRAEHILMVDLLRAYLTRMEEPYIVRGKVSLNEFLSSKFFLMQVMISCFVFPQNTKAFYDCVYAQVREGYPDIIGKYYTTAAEDTKYERLMKECKGRLFDRGEFLLKLDPRLMSEGCRYHASHNSVGSSDNEECPILSLLCCVLYNPDARRFMVDRIPKPKRELVNFFRTHPRPFRYNRKVREDWRRVLDCLKDPSIVYSGAGGGEERFAVSLTNILWVLCGLCGMDKGPLDSLDASMASEDERMGAFLSRAFHFIDELNFFRRGEIHKIADAIFGLIVSNEESRAKLLSCRGDLNYFGVHAILSESGAYMKVGVRLDGGRARFMVVSCTGFNKNVTEAENIVDFLIETYLRHYHNGRCKHTLIGRKDYQYLLLGKHDEDEEVYERYLAMCLDKILNVEEGRLHPRLWRIRSLVLSGGRQRRSAAIGKKSTAAQEIFRLCVERGKLDDIDLREVVGELSECPNMLAHLVKHNLECFRRASDECIMEALCVFISSNRRTMLEYVDKYILVERDRKKILEGAFLDWAHSLINSLFQVSYNKHQDQFERETEILANPYKCFMLFRDYCSIEALHAEAGARALLRRYEHFFRKCPSSGDRDLSLVVVVRETWEELKDMNVLYGYVSELVDGDWVYAFICELLQILMAECVYLPHALCLKMRELYEKRLAREENAARRLALDFILKGLYDLEYEGLSVKDDVLHASDVAYLTKRNPKNKRLLPTEETGDMA
jgi:hypothetical protein